MKGLISPPPEKEKWSPPHGAISIDLKSKRESGVGDRPTEDRVRSGAERRCRSLVAGWARGEDAMQGKLGKRLLPWNH